MDMNAKEFAKANAKVEKNELDKCAHTHTAHTHTHTHTHTRVHAEYVFK